MLLELITLDAATTTLNNIGVWSSATFDSFKNLTIPVEAGLIIGAMLIVFIISAVIFAVRLLLSRFRAKTGMTLSDAYHHYDEL